MKSSGTDWCLAWTKQRICLVFDVTSLFMEETIQYKHINAAVTKWGSVEDVRFHSSEPTFHKHSSQEPHDTEGEFDSKVNELIPDRLPDPVNLNQYTNMFRQGLWFIKTCHETVGYCCVMLLEMWPERPITRRRVFMRWLPGSPSPRLGSVFWSLPRCRSPPRCSPPSSDLQNSPGEQTSNCQWLSKRRNGHTWNKHTFNVRMAVWMASSNSRSLLYLENKNSLSTDLWGEHAPSLSASLTFSPGMFFRSHSSFPLLWLSMQNKPPGNEDKNHQNPAEPKDIFTLKHLQNLGDGNVAARVSLLSRDIQRDLTGTGKGGLHPIQRSAATRRTDGLHWWKKRIKFQLQSLINVNKRVFLCIWSSPPRLRVLLHHWGHSLDKLACGDRLLVN